MQPFKYIQVQSDKSAMDQMVFDGSKFIAGGTNLLDLMKIGVEAPERLVDINPLPLQSIQVDPTGRIHIGALVRNSDLAYHPVIKNRYPVLSEALLSGASPQLRNMATVGGNLMQRTRCPYFYDVEFACNKREPGSGCDALKGYNRSHAVLGGSEQCIATHPSDMCVALVALEANVHTIGRDGMRLIPITEFHLLPGETPDLETVLKPGELITGITLEDLSFSSRSYYLKVRDRASYEFALASAAVALDVQNGKIHGARVALGGVGTKPWRSREAEATLTGAPARDESYRAAAEIALSSAAPHEHNGFKIELARRTLVQALKTAGAMV